MTMVDVSDENFKNEVLNCEIPVLVEFGASWCSPCHAQLPILKKLSEQFNNIKFVKVDIDKSPKACGEFYIKSVPTLMTFKNGKMIKFKVGLCQEQNIIDYFFKDFS